jgi:heptosyltransferase-2/heptosyltransferase-3
VRAALWRVRDAALPYARHLGSRPSDGDPDTLLVMQPDALGDVLLAQPAVRALRAAHPSKRLIGVVGPWSAEIARLAWPVDDIVTVDYPGFGELRSNPVDPYRQLFSDAERLRELHAATAVQLRYDGWWATWLAWLSVSGEVVAGAESRVANFGMQPRVSGTGHAAERAYAIAAGLLPHSEQITPETHPLELMPDPVAAEAAWTLLAERGVTERYIVIHPGTAWPVKLWPSHRWRSVIAVLSDWQVLVTGAQGERALAQELCAGLPNAVPLAGATNLPELVEVLRGAALVAGPDTGPLHLAVATGTPTLTLFGPTSPQQFGPWGPAAHHRVLTAGWRCPRCGDVAGRSAGCGCMLAITREQVLVELRRMLP